MRIFITFSVRLKDGSIITLILKLYSGIFEFSHTIFCVAVSLILLKNADCASKHLQKAMHGRQCI